MARSSRVKFSPWISSDALTQWKNMAGDFRAMTPEVVTQAAVRSAATVKTAAQDIIFTEPDLEDYSDVGEATTVWSDSENVYVGLPSTDPLRSKADEMEDVYPVIDTAFDMAGPTLQSRFEQELLLPGGSQ